MKPFKHKMTVLSQIFKLVPQNLIPKLANEFGIDRQFQVFSPASYVLSLGFGQLTHALGLNDIRDTSKSLWTDEQNSGLRSIEPQRCV